MISFKFHLILICIASILALGCLSFPMQPIQDINIVTRDNTPVSSRIHSIMQSRIQSSTQSSITNNLPVISPFDEYYTYSGIVHIYSISFLSPQNYFVPFALSLQLYQNSTTTPLASSRSFVSFEVSANVSQSSLPSSWRNVVHVTSYSKTTGLTSLAVFPNGLMSGLDISPSDQWALFNQVLNGTSPSWLESLPTFFVRVLVPTSVSALNSPVSSRLRYSYWEVLGSGGDDQDSWSDAFSLASQNSIKLFSPLVEARGALTNLNLPGTSHNHSMTSFPSTLSSKTLTQHQSDFAISSFKANSPNVTINAQHDPQPYDQVNLYAESYGFVLDLPSAPLSCVFLQQTCSNGNNCIWEVDSEYDVLNVSLSSNGLQAVVITPDSPQGSRRFSCDGLSFSQPNMIIYSWYDYISPNTTTVLLLRALNASNLASDFSVLQADSPRPSQDHVVDNTSQFSPLSVNTKTFSLETKQVWEDFESKMQSRVVFQIISENGDILAYNLHPRPKTLSEGSFVAIVVCSVVFGTLAIIIALVFLCAFLNSLHPMFHLNRDSHATTHSSDDDEDDREFSGHTVLETVLRHINQSSPSPALLQSGQSKTQSDTHTEQDPIYDGEPVHFVRHPPKFRKVDEATSGIVSDPSANSVELAEAGVAVSTLADSSITENQSAAGSQAGASSSGRTDGLGQNNESGSADGGAQTSLQSSLVSPGTKRSKLQAKNHSTSFGTITTRSMGSDHNEHTFEDRTEPLEHEWVDDPSNDRQFSQQTQAAGSRRKLAQRAQSGTILNEPASNGATLNINTPNDPKQPTLQSLDEEPTRKATPDSHRKKLGQKMFSSDSISARPGNQLNDNPRFHTSTNQPSSTSRKSARHHISGHQQSVGSTKARSNRSDSTRGVVDSAGGVDLSGEDTNRPRAGTFASTTLGATLSQFTGLGMGENFPHRQAM